MGKNDSKANANTKVVAFKTDGKSQNYAKYVPVVADRNGTGKTAFLIGNDGKLYVRSDIAESGVTQLVFNLA